MFIIWKTLIQCKMNYCSKLWSQKDHAFPSRLESVPRKFTSPPPKFVRAGLSTIAIEETKPERKIWRNCIFQKANKTPKNIEANSWFSHIKRTGSKTHHPSFFTINSTSSILQSTSFNFQSYNRVMILTWKEPSRFPY